MSEFMVEAYVSRIAAKAAGSRVEEVSLAAETLAQEGTAVRFLRSIFVPEDETCFYLYWAESLEAVREAATRAGLRFEHVSEVVSDQAVSHTSEREAAASDRLKTIHHIQPTGGETI